MIIHDAQKRTIENGTEFSFECVWETTGKRRTLKFISSRSDEHAIRDAAAVSLAPIAAFAHEDLHLRFPISKEMVTRLSDYIELFCFEHWGKHTPRITTSEYVNIHKRNERNGVGVAFSGGVDSIYSLYGLLDEHTRVTAVFASGFDTEDDADVSALVSSMRTELDKLDTDLIHIATNIKTLVPEPVGPRWTLMTQTVAAALGIALAPSFGTFYVPTHAHTRALEGFEQPDLMPQLYNNYLHSFLDQTLLSSSDLVIRTHGWDADREEKIERIANTQLARSVLRVCWSDLPETNCGRCMKCMSTRTVLDRFDPESASARFGPVRTPDTRFVQLSDIENFAGAVRSSMRSGSFSDVIRASHLSNRSRIAGLKRHLRGDLF